MQTTDAPAGSIESVLDQMVAPEQLEEEVTEEEAPEAPEESEEQDVEEADEAEEDTDSEEEEPDEETDDDESEQPTDLYTVTVDGEEVQVSLDDLKRGYSGQQYVQKGMKEAAEARKRAEAASETLMTERQKVLQLYQSFMSGELVPPPKPPDESLLQTDPLGYHEQKIKYDHQLQDHQRTAQAFMEQAKAADQAMEEAKRAYAAEQGQMLKAIDPDWGVREKAEAKFSRITEGASKFFDLPAEEVRQVLDHRHIRVLEAAISHMEAQAKAPQVKEKVEKAKVLKAKAKPRNTSQTRKRRSQKERLKRTGDINDALDLLFQ